MKVAGLFTIIMVLTLAACGPHSKYPMVEIRTARGNIIVELYADRAPKSVAAFLANADAGYYKNGSFYRILNDDNQPSDALKAELIQGGAYRSGNKLPKPPPIPHESTRQTGILHKTGVISFARLEPGTASSEFFICISDQPGLDFGGENNPDGQGYAAFGKVIEGMDIINNIYHSRENEQSFDPPILISNIVRL